MKNFTKMKITSWGTQNARTNMINLHTYTARGVDVIMATVLVVDGELLKLTGHVVGGARVDVPIGVNSI